VSSRRWVAIGLNLGGVIANLIAGFETLQDGLLVIPNKDITGSRLYNLSYANGATLRLSVSISAGTDLERVRTLLRRLAPDKTFEIVIVAASDATVTFEVKILEADVSATRELRSALIARAPLGADRASVRRVPRRGHQAVRHQGRSVDPPHWLDVCLDRWVEAL
jgi:small-conductance mechanosensitive channel